MMTRAAHERVCGPRDFGPSAWLQRRMIGLKFRLASFTLGQNWAAMVYEVELSLKFQTGRFPIDRAVMLMRLSPDLGHPTVAVKRIARLGRRLFGKRTKIAYAALMRRQQRRNRSCREVVSVGV